MKINKLEIESFGKFKDYTLDFSTGFQAVFGKNEDGKSTIMSFIELMFYSKVSGGQAVDKNLRKKYTPWDNAKMSGAIEFEKNGKKYRLQKLFAEKGFRDKVSIIDIAKGEEIEIDSDIEIGKQFFGLDLEGFRRSCFIKQLGPVEIGNSGRDDVAEKLLANIAETGSEDYSAEEVIGRLEKAKFDLVNKRGRSGLLSVTEDKLFDLEKELEEVKIKLRSQEEYTLKYNDLLELEREFKQLEKELELLDSLSRRDKLTELLEIAEKHEALENKLTNLNLPLEIRSDFLAENKSLLDQYRSTKSSLDTLSASLTSGELTSITAPEKAELEAQIELKAKLERLSDFFENELKPAHTKMLAAENNLEELAEKHGEFQLELEGIKPKITAIDDAGKRISDNESRLNSTIDSLKDKETLWSEQLAFEEKKHQFSLSQSSQNQVKSPTKYVLLVLGAIVAMIAAICGVLLNPVAYGGVLIGIILIFLAFSKSNQKADISRSTEENSTQLENLKAEINQQRHSLTQAINRFKSEILADHKLIDEFAGIHDSYTLLQSEMEPLTIKLSSERSILSSLADDFTHKFEKLQSLIDNLNLFSIAESEDKSFVLAQYSAEISSWIKDTNDKIKVILKDKSCESVDEFNKKFAAYHGNKAASEKALLLKSEFEKIQFIFADAIRLGGETLSFDESLNKFNAIEALIKTTSETKAHLEQFSHALSIENYSADSVREKLNELHALETASSSILSENNHSQSVDLLNQRYNELESFNITEQLRALAGKIQLPERGQEQIEVEIKELCEKLTEMKDYYEGVSLALQMMEEARDEMRQSFGPQLNEKTGEILSKLTGEKYREVLITKAYDAKVKSGARYQDFRYLSSGTIDQVYLALRLAISELISQSDLKMPIFLDDILAQYDHERLGFALKFLKEYSEANGSQIILFTCHNYMIDEIEKLEIPSARLY